MLETKSAAFTFEEFKVPEFSYNEKNQNGRDLKMGFEPKGEYDEQEGLFKLTLFFAAYEDLPENPVFSLTSIATFQFNDAIKLESIPGYFYRNSIAIMFPYVRAFISNLTVQANTKLLKLGLLNLSSLEKPLIEKTIIVKR